MTKVEVREILRRSLERNLLGPAEGDEEEIEALPAARYIVGVLYPSNTAFDPEQDDGSNIETDDVDTAQDAVNRISMVDKFRQSSMGMSFVVDGNLTEIHPTVRWAMYSQKEKRAPFKRHEYKKRVQVGLDTERPTVVPVDDRHRFHLVCRTYGHESGHKIVSLFLVNMESDPEGEPAKRNTLCIYSPKITVQTDGRMILAREAFVSEADEEDLRSLRLLYHARHEFGVGHGCSVLWKDVEQNRCSTIGTTFLPSFLQQPIVFRNETFPLPMHILSVRGDKESTLAVLRNLADSYEEWIGSSFDGALRERLDPALQETFDQHLEWCKESLERIREGIGLLESDDLVFEAFCFMNEAMCLQRLHYEAARDFQKTKRFVEPRIEDLGDEGGPMWRPFQIAFILQTIPGVVEPGHEHHDIVDLLWIPTGGGKTEAYLGLAAFTMALRRLRNRGEPFTSYAGLSVAMRYTLRLLTIQQFQRAVTLMCACEVLRDRNVAKWGQEPFLVGLYVGQSTTPNKIGNRDDFDYITSDPQRYSYRSDTACFALEHWKRKGEKPRRSNPFQLQNCPWCGLELGRRSYHVDQRNHLVTHCARSECIFNEKLEVPAVTVDEDIYSRLPSFVVATVDKFAMLPFNPRVGALFGHVDRICPRHGFLTPVDTGHPDSHDKGTIQVRPLEQPLSPPDLIIQDELHLINGPLGSMVGMYETTVERLCSRFKDGESITPKYIASTATVRRAGDQVWNLYQRRFRRFPSPGVDYSDSFFVGEERNDEEAKMFIGVFPSGIGHKTVMVRTLSSLLTELQRIRDRGELPIQDWDEYWTLIAYFNSIRELGSAKTTMEDDIQNRVGKDVRELCIEELTSRIDSRDLPEILTKLGKGADEDGAVDILACSNMFSVGVDVQRLGVMVMHNQPKSSSEYIQSTGRVGRNKTGLVVVLYNWVRPRDQSHFERFFDYHNRIQSHVEAMTVTPFSRGVRERSLHAQYVALTRILTSGGLARNSDARGFDAAIRGNPMSRSYEHLLKSRMEALGTGRPNELEEELKHFLDLWVNWADESDLKYQRFFSEKDILMRRVGDDHSSLRGPRVLTPTSMRNVEEEIAIHKVLGFPPGGRL